ncbi:hypothetical protein FOXB_16810 [Fusarium oxysporum f. sp. conglutinans Fo5176]|uniref:Uncharacterized protein n=1 Tax=Fusarium oxysporum (strain Fo5176) TaxID=660025 RepID=F9GDS6_FUSOF|nr:hypothetical protein FOXB_16810 [Fusarium oxysporum f. sp. conglutinans Fo5176]
MPQTTLSDRLRGLPSIPKVTHPAQLLSKSQEISQVRATVTALLQQQDRERPIGVH